MESSKQLRTGRYAPPDIQLLLREEQARWARRPFAFLREIPSHPETPLSYYRFRSSKTFFLTIAVVTALESKVELRLVAQEQAGCFGLRRQPAPLEVRFTVLPPR